MELHHLEHILAIAEAGSINEAAKRLYLTQSALNQQLLRLEEELGTQLFSRSRNHFAVTEAGAVYLEGAREILRIQRDTYSRIQDLTREKRGTIRIGLTPDRGMRMFSAIYPQFYQRYPEVKVIPAELIASVQEEKIAAGDLDLGFLTLSPEQQTCNAYIRLWAEQLVLVVPASHPLAGEGSPFREDLPDGLPEIGLDKFRQDQFALISRESSMRSLVDSCFEQAGVTPRILLETRSSMTLFQLVQSLDCCSILPAAYARPSARVVYFALPGRPAWDLAVSYPRRSYLDEARRALIGLAAEYWKCSPFLYRHGTETAGE